jgi:Cu/Ag efflux pump CusA
MAYTLIGGTAAGTILTLIFLPALYAIWFKIKPPREEETDATPVPHPAPAL